MSEPAELWNTTPPVKRSMKAVPPIESRQKGLSSMAKKFPTKLEMPRAARLTRPPQAGPKSYRAQRD